MNRLVKFELQKRKRETDLFCYETGIEEEEPDFVLPMPSLFVTELWGTGENESYYYKPDFDSFRWPVSMNNINQLLNTTAPEQRNLLPHVGVGPAPVGLDLPILMQMMNYKLDKCCRTCQKNKEFMETHEPEFLWELTDYTNLRCYHPLPKGQKRRPNENQRYKEKFHLDLWLWKNDLSPKKKQDFLNFAAKELELDSLKWSDVVKDELLYYFIYVKFLQKIHQDKIDKKLKNGISMSGKPLRKRKL